MTWMKLAMWFGAACVAAASVYVGQMDGGTMAAMAMMGISGAMAGATSKEIGAKK